MPVTALALALIAAFVHALWNILLARAQDIESSTAVALITAELVFAPVVVFTWDAHWAVWPFLIASGLLQLMYFALLATAYRLVPLSIVYPIARGGAPVLVLLFGAVALGRTTSRTQVAAVVLVVAGILLVRGFRGADPRGVAFGLAIASCIAVYTLVDKEGVRHGDRPGIDRRGHLHVRSVRARAGGAAAGVGRVGRRRAGDERRDRRPARRGGAEGEGQRPTARGCRARCGRRCAAGAWCLTPLGTLVSGEPMGRCLTPVELRRALGSTGATSVVTTPALAWSPTLLPGFVRRSARRSDKGAPRRTPLCRTDQARSTCRTRP